MLEAADGEQRSYLEIAEVIERVSPKATSGWRQMAAELGIPNSQADRMAVAYESDQRRIARSLGPS